MYGCDPWKDKEDAIERRLDVVESKTLDHDRDLIDLNETVDTNRTFAEALISTRASRGAFSDIEVAANTSTVIIAMEREDGGIVLRSMPVVTPDNAGVAPPSLFSEVAVLRSEVDVMKGTVVWYPNAQNTLTNGMTSTQVAISFAAAYPEVVPGDGAIYQNTDGTAGYRYSHLLESWVEIFDGVSIRQFTNATLGMIKGSAAEGQIFAENDGTGSVVGWDDLITDVGELMVNKEDAANKVNAWSVTPGNSKYPSEKLTKDSLDGKVASNTPITAGTKTKITYDSKGLVTAGDNLETTDIPSLSADKITSGIFASTRIPTLTISKTSGLQTALDGKQGTLTFDNAPVSGSGNPVKSGGVYTALAGKQDSFSLYEHTIRVWCTTWGNIGVSLTVLNQSATAFTLQTLYNHLGSSTNDFKQCSGVAWVGVHPVDLIGIRRGLANQLIFQAVSRVDGNPEVTVTLDWTQIEVVLIDKVRQIV